MSNLRVIQVGENTKSSKKIVFYRVFHEHKEMKFSYTQEKSGHGKRPLKNTNRQSPGGPHLAGRLWKFVHDHGVFTLFVIKFPPINHGISSMIIHDSWILLSWTDLRHGEPCPIYQSWTIIHGRSTWEPKQNTNSKRPPMEVFGTVRQTLSHKNNHTSFNAPKKVENHDLQNQEVLWILSAVFDNFFRPNKNGHPCFYAFSRKLKKFEKLQHPSPLLSLPLSKLILTSGANFGQCRLIEVSWKSCIFPKFVQIIALHSFITPPKLLKNIKFEWWRILFCILRHVKSKFLTVKTKSFTTLSISKPFWIQVYQSRVD